MGRSYKTTLLLSLDWMVDWLLNSAIVKLSFLVQPIGTTSSRLPPPSIRFIQHHWVIARFMDLQIMRLGRKMTPARIPLVASIRRGHGISSPTSYGAAPSFGTASYLIEEPPPLNKE